MRAQHILVTGASGFVGGHLVRLLADDGRTVRSASRAMPAAADGAATHVRVGDYDDASLLAKACQGIDTVCHLAGRAHVVDKAPADSRTLFREANVAATRRLAEAAFAAGVRRFLFVSSIGAVASASEPGRPLGETTAPAPVTPYGESKLEAESVLRAIAERADAEWVVVRPPLVHGRGAPGNMHRLARWIDAGLPLPLASLANQRSLVHVENLTRLLLLCCDDPRAANLVFHVRDRHDYTTAEIVRGIGAARARPARLWPFPAVLLGGIATLTGQGTAFAQLAGWLQIDDARARSVLGFVPEDLAVAA
ncbi:MAG: NAD-dependent epimerase/dehydratase family protein [Caldimonas sp.]